LDEDSEVDPVSADPHPDPSADPVLEEGLTFLGAAAKNYNKCYRYSPCGESGSHGHHESHDDYGGICP